MKRILIPGGILFFILALAAGVWAQEPRVLVSKPADGATNVPLDVGELHIFFSQPMSTGSWSLLELQGCEFPPIINTDKPWRDNQTFVMKLQSLKPGVKYGVQLNNAVKKGFKSADGQIALQPTSIRFETGPGSKEDDGKKEKTSPLQAR